MQCLWNLHVRHNSPSYIIDLLGTGCALNWIYACVFFFAGDITQKGYEKKKAKILAPYLKPSKPYPVCYSLPTPVH